MVLPAWAKAIDYLMYAVEAGGTAVGVARWGRLAPGQRIIATWFAIAVVVNALGAVLSQKLHSAQPFANIWHLISVLLVMSALATFQTTAVAAARYRYSAAGFLLIWLLLLVTVESIGRYSTYSAPLHAMVILVGASWVLVQRVARGRSDAALDPQFLMAAGLCGYAIAAVFKTLVAQLWLADHPAYVAAYYSACNLITVLAELLIIRAFFLSDRRHLRSPAMAQ